VSKQQRKPLRNAALGKALDIGGGRGYTVFVARRNHAVLAVFVSLSASAAPSPVSAQEFLNPNVEGGCGLGTDKTVVDRSVGGRSIRLPADGTVGTIAFADDAIADGTLDAEVTGSCRQEGNRVTVFAKGRVVNRAAFTSNTQASAGFSLNMRPHAKPFNTDYLLRAAGTFAVTWDRGTAGALGGASAGFSMTNCDPGGNKSFAAGAGPGASGVAVSSGTVECRRRSGNPFGFLESDVPVSLGASVHQFAGAPQEFAFEGTVVFELLRVGKEIRVVGSPTEGAAGAPFPRPFEVLVVNNGNNVPAGGEAVRFRLLDAAGTEVSAVDATTQGDGKASANFTAPAGGVFKVEAVCAGCPASSQELGQGSKVVFPPVDVRSGELTALPGPREGPVGGTLELAFKATEKVLVGGAIEERGIAGTPISFAVTGPEGDASLSPNPATTGQDGVARTTLRLGSAAGAYEVTATCAACAAKPSDRIAVLAEENRVTMAKVAGSESGDGQHDVFGVQFSTPFRAQLRSPTGPAPNRRVEFSCRFEGAPSGFRLAAAGPADPAGQPCDEQLSALLDDSDGGGLVETRLTPSAPGTYRISALCSDCVEGGREATFLAKAELQPPKAKEGDSGPDSGAPYAGACSAKLVQIAPGPDGEPARKPPAPLLVCSNSNVLLTCRVTPLVEGNTCASWSVTPGNDNVRVRAVGDVTGELTTTNDVAGDFTVQAKSVIGECQARRAIRVGFATIKSVGPPGATPKADEDIKLGQSKAIAVEFEVLKNMPPELLNEFVEIEVFNDTGGISESIEVLTATRKASNGGLSFAVKGVKDAFDTAEFFGKVVVRVCGSEGSSTLLLAPTAP
jgi:hypothetical protein